MPPRVIKLWTEKRFLVHLTNNGKLTSDALAERRRNDGRDGLVGTSDADWIGRDGLNHGNLSESGGACRCAQLILCGPLIGRTNAPFLSVCLAHLVLRQLDWSIRFGETATIDQ
jgi:hypothetical protein